MDTSSWTPSPPQYDEAEYLLRLSSLKLKAKGHKTRLVSTVLIRSVYQKALGVVSSPTRSPEQSWGDDVKASPRPSIWDVVEKDDSLRKRRRGEEEDGGERSKRQRDDDDDMMCDDDTTPPSPPTVDEATLVALEAAALGSTEDEDEEDDDSAMMLGIEYHLRRMASE